MPLPLCPRCSASQVIKSGVVKNRQRYFCKKCNYYFTVSKLGKQIDDYYVIKALQLYLEGVSYREIERLIGVSHVSVMNWVKKYRIKAPDRYGYKPTYSILSFKELQDYISNMGDLKSTGILLTQLGDKYMLIKWQRIKSS